MNSRFSEYTTSGAFSISLTRNQVSSLAMLDGGAPCWVSSVVASLERKGLAERVADPSDENPERIEYRATYAGLLTAQLCQEAGLTNGSENAVAAELSSLNSQLEEARRQRAEEQLVARSALARLDEVELDLENARRELDGRKLAIRMYRRDPTPDLTKAELRERAGLDGR